MKLEDFLREMEDFTKIIIASRGRYNNEYILSIDCWIEGTRGKFFSGEAYRCDPDDLIEIYRYDDNPLYGLNTTREILDACKTISLDDDLTELDWQIYPTRAELLTEIATLKARIAELERSAQHD